MITFLQLVLACVIGNYIALFLIVITKGKDENKKMVDVEVSNEDDIELLKKIIERNKK